MKKVEAVRARSELDALKAVLLLAHLDEEGFYLTLDDGDSVVAGFMEWSVERARAALNEAAALGLITPDQGSPPGVRALPNGAIQPHTATGGTR